jgi:23S rRNA pseudouridine1911/1915/1917 synthase
MPEFSITPEDGGKRLDRYLTQKLPMHSRAYLQQLIEHKHVLVDGRTTKPGYRLRADEQIVVTLPPSKPSGVLPESIPLDVLSEDAHLLVVNKAAGMVVHPSPGNTSGTLVNALLAHCTQLSGIGGIERPGIVHRLDKDTSGAIVVAKDDATHRGLARQFAERQVRKRYLAIVRGDIRNAEGVIDAAVGRHPVHRQKMSTHTRVGRQAVTAFRVLERFGVYTLVELSPHTGRTHQIRVHMAAVGHPLLGDPTYGRDHKELHHSPLAYQLSWFRRQALHAWILGFMHPATAEWFECRAPLPADLEHLLVTLRHEACAAEGDHRNPFPPERSWSRISSPMVEKVYSDKRGGKGQVGDSSMREKAMAEPTVTQQRPILALVNDLFFTLKIADTAKSVGFPIYFAGSSEELLNCFRKTYPALIIADLTLDGVDQAALFEQLAVAANQATLPILGYTTHADWKRTGPLHDRCTKVVTKDVLSRSLADLIQQLIEQG